MSRSPHPPDDDAAPSAPDRSSERDPRPPVYPSRYYDFLSPALFHYCAALHGWSTSLAPGFRYLEVGCGGGVSLCTLAAAWPEGHFIGVDNNPQHIAAARELAEAAQLENLWLIEADLRELGPGSLPELDYVVAHGVYSWVGAQVRAALHELLEERLRVGGCCLISYNALPGSAAWSVVREMLLSYTGGEPSLERVQQSIRYLHFLAESDADFFVEHPAIRESVKGYREQDFSLLFHEFLGEDWTPMYFSQVERQLAGSGLVYAGSLPLVCNYHQLVVPPRFHELLAGAPDRSTLETHKAFLINERFRRDLFVKPDAERVPEQRRMRLLEPLVFSASVAHPDRRVTVRMGGRSVRLDYEGPLHEALRHELLTNPGSFEQLSRRPALERFDNEELYHGLTLLCAGSQYGHARVAPAAEQPVEPQIALDPLNRELLERECLERDEAAWLASQVLGDGLRVAALDGVLLFGLATEGRERCVDWTLAQLEQRGRQLLHDGEPVAAAERRRLLEGMLDRLLGARLAWLARMRVLSAASAAQK